MMGGRKRDCSLFKTKCMCETLVEDDHGCQGIFSGRVAHSHSLSGLQTVMSCNDIAIIFIRDLLKLAIVAQMKMTGKDQSHPRHCRGKTLFLRSNHSKSHNKDRDTLPGCNTPQIAMTCLKGGGDVVIESLD